MTNYQFKPYNDQILILPEEKETETESGIIAPEGLGDQPKIALVVAVGGGKYSEYPIPATQSRLGGSASPSVFYTKIPMDIRVGDKVLFKSWGTNSVKMNGKEHFLLKQEDVLAVVEEAKVSDKN